MPLQPDPVVEPLRHDGVSKSCATGTLISGAGPNPVPDLPIVPLLIVARRSVWMHGDFPIACPVVAPNRTGCSVIIPIARVVAGEEDVGCVEHVERHTLGGAILHIPK